MGKKVTLLYHISWFLLAASVCLSKFSTSVFMFVCFITWLFSNSVAEKKQNFSAHKLKIFGCSVLLLVVIAGWIKTDNWSFALHDFKVKLPILLAPLFLLTGPEIDRKMVKRIFFGLSLGAVTAALLGHINYNFFTDQTDFRKLSPFISHIRLSLALCFAVVVFYDSFMSSKKAYRWLYFIPLAYALYFVNILQSLSSLVIIPVLLFYVGMVNPPWRLGKILGRIALAVFVFSFILLSWKVYSIYKIEFKEVHRPADPEEFTVNGNIYYHEYKDNSIENGAYVMMYVCDEELSREWEKKSNIAYLDTVNEFPLRACLLRYMTSKGLRKDSLGFTQITQEEISAIEKGIANVNFLDGRGIATRIHIAMWELRRWRDGMQRHESSVSMRLFLWKSGFELIEQNLVFGIGAGDLQDAYVDVFKNSIHHESTSIRRAHNQYLTVAIGGGMLACFFFLLWLISIFKSYDGTHKFLFTAGAIVYSMGMLWEDSLESQAGVALAIILLIYPLAERKSTEKSK